MTGKSPDLILDTAPVSGALPALVKIAGDPKRVVTISDFAAAQELGVRINIEEGTTMPYDVLGDFARLAAEGRFTVPIARSYPLEDWRAALDVSQSQKAHGKLILLPSSADPFVQPDLLGKQLGQACMGHLGVTLGSLVAPISDEKSPHVGQRPASAYVKRARGFEQSPSPSSQF